MDDVLHAVDLDRRLVGLHGGDLAAARPDGCKRPISMSLAFLGAHGAHRLAPPTSCCPHWLPADLPPGQRSRISWVRPERYGRSSLFDIPLPSVYPLGEVAVAARSNDVAVARLFDHLVSEREQRRWRAQRTTAICDSHSRISSTLRTYTLDTHCECQTGAALATSFGHTVTSSFLRHWTMIGTESMSSPV